MHSLQAENQSIGQDEVPTLVPTLPADDRDLWDAAAVGAEDVYRQVYCILGMPIDAIEMSALGRIAEVVSNGAFFFLSTPNLNFLVHNQTDPEFRESLLLSDLCPADGMPVVWIARLMGISIRRVAGSDIFEALKSRLGTERPLKVFFYGATENVATAAARALNTGSPSLKCVGWTCPGFGTLDELSQDRFINKINSSGADLLIVALGAKKGQLWLHRNHRCLVVPLRAHLGVTIHFRAGTVKRAPYAIQKLGLDRSFGGIIGTTEARCSALC